LRYQVLIIDNYNVNEIGAWYGKTMQGGKMRWSGLNLIKFRVKIAKVARGKYKELIQFSCCSSPLFVFFFVVVFLKPLILVLLLLLFFS